MRMFCLLFVWDFFFFWSAISNRVVDCLTNRFSFNVKRVQPPPAHWICTIDCTVIFIFYLFFSPRELFYTLPTVLDVTVQCFLLPYSKKNKNKKQKKGAKFPVPSCVEFASSLSAWGRSSSHSFLPQSKRKKEKKNTHEIN